MKTLFRFASSVGRSWSRRRMTGFHVTTSSVDPLESRVVLTNTVDPVLVIITHGFSGFNLWDEHIAGGSPSLNESDWSTKLDDEVRKTSALLSPIPTRPDSNGLKYDVGPYGFFIEPVYGSPQNVVINVDWNSGSVPFNLNSPIPPPADSLVLAIETFLIGSDSPRWDIMTFGHSRGGVFNNYVLQRLTEDAAFNPTLKDKLGFVDEIELDSTAAIPFGDDLLFPSKVPEIVSRARNYHDNKVLISGATYDVTDLDAAPHVAVSADVSSGVDDLLKRSKVTPLTHSAVSHVQLPTWYVNSYFLAGDLSVFFTLKDKGDPESPIQVGELPSTGDEPGKTPTGHGGIPDANNQGGDDHPNAFGPSATVVSIGQSKSGAIETSGDHDWFQFRPTQNGPIQIEVIPLNSSLAPYVRFHWDNKILIRQDTGGGSKGGAKISYANGEAGRTYFIDISGAGGTTGSYLFRVTQPSTVETDPADETAPTSPVVDDYPDTKADAKIVVLDSTGSASISGTIKSPLDNTDDIDWFQFVAKTTGKLVVEIGTPNSSLDTHLRLHNSSVLLAQDHDRVEANVIAGQTYWLQVRAGSDASSTEIRPGFDRTGKYVVRITQPSLIAGGSGTDEPEGPLPGWGGIRGVQIHLDPNGNGNSLGSISEPTDVKWFQINGPSQGNMVVQVLPVNDDLKPFVTAFRSNGGGIDTDTGEFDGEAKVGFTVGANETIIVAVSSHEGRSTGGFTINVSQPDSLPDDDVNDFGQPARNLGPEITQEGDGSFDAKIETPDDNDWFEIPIRGSGYLSIDITPRDSGIIPFLELSSDGTSGGFFETDAGYDGHAHISFLPAPGQTSVWAKVSSADGTQGAYTLTTWRTQNPDDDYPDAGGVFLPSHELAPRGQIFITGRIDNPGDSDNFHIRVDQPGPVAVQIISLTDGFKPFFSRARQSSDPNQRTGTSGSDSGRGGRAFEIIPGILPADDNWLVIDVKAGSDSTVPFGDYIVQVWQPGSDVDIDADTVGIEASPVLVDGSGNGILPGNPNGGAASPSIDYAGDKDVFQVVAAANRPITITVNGTAINNGTFLRIYDSSGRAVATDYNSGPNNSSQITLDANRGDLFYIEVSAYDGSSTGAYTVQVSQAQDDHPDRANFTPALGQTWDSTPIVLDTSGFGQASGNIDSTLLGDRDCFQVLASAHGRMTINVAGTDGTLDVYLRVYDSRGNLVAIDDDGGEGRDASVTFNTFQDETYFIEVSGYNDQSVGAYLVEVQFDDLKQQTIVGKYDDFNDRHRDAYRWQDYQPIVGYVSESVSGRQDLELYADGSSSPDNNTAATRSIATIQGGVTFTAAVILGSEIYNQSEIELRDSTDQDRSLGNRIRITFARQQQNGAVYATVSGLGYDELFNSGPVQYAENSGFTWNIQESADRSEVSVFLNNQLVATFRGPLSPNSYLWARSITAGGPGRFAKLNLDEVFVREASLSLPSLKLYDNFDDNSIDPEKFHISGAVHERDGAIGLSLFEQGNAVSGYISTNGNPDGINLRGFRASTNRTTEPKKLTGWDTIARMRLTNGQDYIQIGWNLADNTFRVETVGAYGVHSVDIPVPAGEVPDGPVEVRERDGNIEVLHNGLVKLTLIGQTVRSGSFFTFETAGNPYGQSTNSPPQDFGVFLDNLEFYHEPLENGDLVTPTLQQGSDSGTSNTDHVTNQLALNFDWPSGPNGTTYQWREGKLEGDGSISYGEWSFPQTETTANVQLPGASVHVFSVRTIDTNGVAGNESSLGVQVDVIAPTWTSSSFVPDSVPHVNVEFSEPVVGNLSNLVIRDPSNQIITPTSLSGSGTSLLDLVFSDFDQLGTYSISQSGLEDVAGNPVVETQLGTFNITNQAPTDIAISAVSVLENAPDTVVGSLSAIDPDAWNSHTYVILPGGDGSQFVISGNELRVGPAGLDFEAGSVRTVMIRATDQFGESVDQQLTINVIDTNDAPVLDNSGDTHLAPIGEDNLHNGGTLIPNLISSVGPLTMITDQDSGSVMGIAIYAVDTANGTWEYSLDSGSTWMAMGTVSTTSARLLSASTSTLIRFLPNANFNGQSSLLFCAWDQSSGTNRDTADISTRGGTTAFSSATETATLTVVPVNDAPVLNNTENPTLPSIDEDSVDNNGTPISAIIGNISTDVDAGAVQGIAIYNANTTNGRWQFSTNNGTSWADIGNVTAASARLIPADSSTRIRFVPDANFNGTSTFHFCAWDQTSGAIGGTADVSTRGGASAFSTGTVFATLTINPVEDPPFLNIPVSPVPQFFKGDTSIMVFPGTAAGDVDANGLQGGTLVLMMKAVKNKKGWFDELNLPSVSTIGSDAEDRLDDGTITHRIQLKSDVTDSEVEDFLQSITFSTFKKGLKRSPRLVQLTLTDADGLSTTRTQTIEVSKHPRR